MSQITLYQFPQTKKITQGLRRQSRKKLCLFILFGVSRDFSNTPLAWRIHNILTFCRMLECFHEFKKGFAVR